MSTTSAHDVRKTVTVVFCDVTGSTSLGERLDPESLRDVQLRYFAAMRDAVDRHGGTVEKYIGDAVMAVFGIPRLHEDDALRAVRAAIEMREAIPVLNAALERERGVTIQVRIGVNTGEVVAGDTGEGHGFVSGDAVNVAARIEQLARPGDVLLGEATHMLVRGEVEAESIEPLAAKGKTEKVAVWRVVDVRGPAEPIQRQPGVPLVGRDGELAMLRRALDSAVSGGVPSLVTVIGDAGMGKSRLSEEALNGLPEGASVLRGRCPPYGEGLTYFPVVEAIKQAVWTIDADRPGTVDRKVRSILEDDERGELACANVLELLGAEGPAIAEDTGWAIWRFFEALARRQPLVLVLDDIQWGEPALLDLIVYIAARSEAPIVLLCMARPELLEARPSWGAVAGAMTVVLEPLPPAGSTALVANVLRGGELPVDVSRWVVETAEGNPLFIEQLLAMLIEEGLVVRQRDVWVLTAELTDVSAPPSIQALLAARVDGLDPTERSYLEAAAVIGQAFSASAVVSLVPRDLRADLPTTVGSLMRKGLIARRDAGPLDEDALRFGHLLIRDAAYGAITKAGRSDLHERFADWLQSEGSHTLTDNDEVLGYHLEQAYRYRKQLGPVDERSAALGLRASGHLASAGRRALGRGDHAAAVKLLRRAHELGPDRGIERAMIMHELGYALGWVADARAEVAVQDEAARLAAEAGDRSLEWKARIRCSGAEMLVDPHAKSTVEFRRELEDALGVFDRLRDEAGLALTWTELGFLEWNPLRYDAAASALAHAVEHARRSGERRLITRAALNRVNAQLFGSATPDEIRRTLDAHAADIALGRQFEAFALRSLGETLVFDGDFGEGRRLIASALEILEALGHTFMMASSNEVLGDVELLAGDLVAAERAYRRSFEILDELHDVAHRSTSSANLARVLAAAGRLDEAERYADFARETAAEEDLASQAPGRSIQALVLAGRGEFETAERLAHEAVNMLREAQCPSLQGDAWMDLAKVVVTTGDLARAEDAAREALALFERKGIRPAADSAKVFIEELGDPNHPSSAGTNDGSRPHP